ncbi:MAG: hypothetical protein EXQ56_01435 [Acidobacteria bacterium]|nr:hypothetical protein [Acidobacteriota bacterium]
MTRYQRLPNDGRESDGYNYTAEALSIFPRYNVLDAIRFETEQMNPDLLESLDQTRQQLLAADKSGSTMFTREPCGPIESAAISQERELFCAYIANLTIDQLGRVEPMPYKRALSSGKSKQLWDRLDSIWKFDGPTSEYLQKGLAIFKAQAFECTISIESLRALLASHGIRRVWQLIDVQDIEPYYEIETNLLDLQYDWDRYWTSGEFDWIIWASHEHSVTVGGWLLDSIKAAWPGWREGIWDPALD